MNPTSGNTVSIWVDTAEVPQCETLKKDIKTEICVIGAGITGLTCAYLLLKEGKKVIVVDGGEVGGGESGRTTAHITNVIDDRYFVIEKFHGEKASPDSDAFRSRYACQYSTPYAFWRLRRGQEQTTFSNSSHRVV